MGEALLPPAAAAPVGWRAQTALAACWPAMVALYRAILPEMRAIEAGLDRDEAAGHDRSHPRQALAELRWRLEYTADCAAAAAALERLRRAVARPSPRAPATDAEGSFGTGTEVWFLKLDASVDHWLGPDAGPVVPPRLLDRVNHPDRLIEYLRGLLVSRPREAGIDHRKELNFATANLVRLILWGRPLGYRWDPRLEPLIRRFVADWQDPATGFFGITYEIDGVRRRTADLSMTFHMARYLDGAIGYWPQLIDTLIALKESRYPNGWLDETGLTPHNAYDVAVLFRLGWDKLGAERRGRVRCEVQRLLDWCLAQAVGADGRVTVRAVSESLPESYYFTVALLDTLGCFGPQKPFWTDRPFAGAAALKARLEAQISGLDPAQPMARMALARLRGA
jgi:hypothetical protein